jgi:hypothetical protein
VRRRASSSAIGIGLRQHCRTPNACHGHPGQAHRAASPWQNGFAERLSDRSGASVWIILSSWVRLICATSCEPTLAITIIYQNALVFGQRYAGLSRRSADRIYQIARDRRRTSPSLRSRLGFRYTQLYGTPPPRRYMSTRSEAAEEESVTAERSVISVSRPSLDLSVVVRRLLADDALLLGWRLSPRRTGRGLDLRQDFRRRVNLRLSSQYEWRRHVGRRCGRAGEDLFRIRTPRPWQIVLVCVHRMPRLWQTVLGGDARLRVHAPSTAEEISLRLENPVTYLLA